MFLHATLEEAEHVIVEIPAWKKGKVLKHKKTLCSLCQTPHAFWNYFIEKLEACGISQSKLDTCLFIRDEVTCISHLADLLFWPKHKALMHDLAISYNKLALTCNRKMMVQDFLISE